MGESDAVLRILERTLDDIRERSRADADRHNLALEKIASTQTAMSEAIVRTYEAGVAERAALMQTIQATAMTADERQALIQRRREDFEFIGSKWGGWKGVAAKNADKLIGAAVILALAAALVWVVTSEQKINAARGYVAPTAVESAKVGSHESAPTVNVHVDSPPALPTVNPMPDVGP